MIYVLVKMRPVCKPHLWCNC